MTAWLESLCMERISPECNTSNLGILGREGGTNPR